MNDEREIGKPETQRHVEELSSADLDGLVGGTSQQTCSGTTQQTSTNESNADVVGGALTAGKVAVPWAILKK